MEESRDEMINFLEKKCQNLFNYVDKQSVYPYSFIITESELKCYQEIHIALESIIKCVVQNYRFDSRIRDVYQFPDKVKRILDQYKDKPYINIGAYRPDFLYEDKIGTEKICEINARFPTNGYLITFFGNEFETNGKHSSKKLPSISHFIDDYKTYFDFSQPVCILKDKEKGFDINLLKEFFQNIFYVKPDDLKFESNKLFFYSNNNEKKFVNQFILELHQKEILSFSEDILFYMIQYCKLLNDFRTIFMIHDKRFLHILSRDDILFDYMSIENHKTIRKHRINTLLNKQILSKDCDIKKNKQKWLLKPTSLGKCQGIVLGKNVNVERWIQVVDNLQQNFVIQEYIEQKKIFLKSLKNCYIVGTLLCFNDTFYCPGIYRASKKDLVSLSQVGLILYPSVQPDLLINISNASGVYFNHKPFLINQECFYTIESFSFKDADLYLNSLLKHGFVLLELKFEDTGSNFLMSLLQSLNMQPRSHGNKDRDYLWDIKPFLTGPAAPRSHTDEIFQMHTDASYDINPARYFALECLHSDRFNGGQNLVIKLQDILKELTQNEIDLLLSVKIKIKIPQEFKRKEMTEDFILGSILYRKFGEILVRYRHDIILDVNELCDKYIEALKKFERLINLEDSNLIHYFNMKDGQILLMDNSRFLHGRTKIFDQNRHFVRIRFDCLDNKIK